MIQPSAVNAKDSGAIKRFLREVRLASELDHPFAAHIYGLGAESDATLWIVMDLVRGESLNTLSAAYRHGNSRAWL